MNKLVCEACLRKFWGGAEKACSHGWDFINKRPKSGTCSRCGQHAESLHCPDGAPQEIR